MKLVNKTLILTKVQVLLGKTEDYEIPKSILGTIDQSKSFKTDFQKHRYVLKGENLYGKEGYVCECSAAFVDQKSARKHFGEDATNFKYVSVDESAIGSETPPSTEENTSETQSDEQQMLQQAACNGQSQINGRNDVRNPVTQQSKLLKKKKPKQMILKAVHSVKRMSGAKYSAEKLKIRYQANMCWPKRHVMILDAIVMEHGYRLSALYRKVLARNLNVSSSVLEHVFWNSRRRAVIKEEYKYKKYITEKMKVEAERIHQSILIELSMANVISETRQSKSLPSKNSLIIQTMAHIRRQKVDKFYLESLAKKLPEDFYILCKYWDKIIDRINSNKGSTHCRLITPDIMNEAHKLDKEIEEELSKIPLKDRDLKSKRLIVEYIYTAFGNHFGILYKEECAKLLGITYTKIRWWIKQRIKRWKKSTDVPSEEVIEKIETLHETILSNLKAQQKGEKLRIRNALKEQVAKKIMICIFSKHGFNQNQCYLKTCAAFLQITKSQIMKYLKEALKQQPRDYMDEIQIRAQNLHEKVMACIHTAWKNSNPNVDFESIQ